METWIWLPLYMTAGFFWFGVVHAVHDIAKKDAPNFVLGMSLLLWPFIGAATTGAVLAFVIAERLKRC